MSKQTTTPTHEAIFGATPLPCPPWCDLPAGHGFDGADHVERARFHRKVVAEVTVVAYEDSRQMSVSVDLRSMETAALDEPRVLATTPVMLALLGMQEGAELNAEDARKVAQLLELGVQALDALTDPA